MHNLIGRMTRDTITQFTGVVTGRCEYITGCSQLGITSQVNEQNKESKTLWFDEIRCEILDTTPRIVIGNKLDPGGPQNHPCGSQNHPS